MLRDSNLFQMAGRMIGHSFVHGGPCLSGLSLPLVILLTRGSSDSAASALELQDCPDLDHRETISLVSTCTLFNICYFCKSMSLNHLKAFSICGVLAAQENRTH